MKRLIGMLIGLVALVGCATNGSVKEKIDPLADRLTKVEERLAGVDAKLADMGKKDDAQLAELRGMKQDLADSSAQAQKAQKAQMDAEAAAQRAEAAASKTTKAFELHQKK